MHTKAQHLDTLQDIKQIMERSSRFISLSGLSGVAAGCCALIGAWFANRTIEHAKTSHINLRNISGGDNLNVTLSDWLKNPLVQIAVITFIAAFILAFIFTYLRSKKTNIPVWGAMAKRLMINVFLPMIAGGIFILKLVDNGVYDFIAPGCLVFYGLALLNASKYTLPETRYLGCMLMLLGIINLWFTGSGLIFWALGFGILHIMYGIYMWWKYERS